MDRPPSQNPFVPPRDPLADPRATEGRRRYAGPDFLGDGWCPDGRRRPEVPETEWRPVTLVLFCLFWLVVLLLGGAVTDSGRSSHVWALIGFILLAAVIVLQVVLIVRRWRRNRAILRIDPPGAAIRASRGRGPFPTRPGGY